MQRQLNKDEVKAGIDYSLTNKRPSDKAIENIESFREVAKQLGHAIVDYVPAGRAQALAITKLEEAVMWAVKGIALDSE